MTAAGAIFLISGIIALLQQHWSDAVIAFILLALVFVPVVTERIVDLRIPLNLQAQYGLLLSTGPYLGGYWGWYEAWEPWDTWVHLYSGIFISFGLVLALGKVLHVHQLHLPLWLEMVLLITVKAFIALLWEIAEFVYDIIFDGNAQHHNLDTMTDMIAGLGPSLVIAGMLYYHRRRNRFGYLGSLLHAGQQPR